MTNKTINKAFKTILSAVLALSLSACGLGQGGAGDVPGVGNTDNRTTSSDNQYSSDVANRGDTGGNSDDTGSGSDYSDNSGNVASDNPTAQAPKNGAKAPWDGTYAIDYSYRQNNGYMIANVTPEGLIHFKVAINDMTFEYDTEESNFDEATYVYGTYISADAKPVDRDRAGGDVSFAYKNDPDGVSIKFRLSDYDKDLYLDEEFKLFTPWHTAPADYEDKDVDGFISALDISTEPFKPVTDNYSVSYYSSDWLFFSGNDIKCETYTLKSYDVNNHVIQTVKCYVLESEGVATAALNAYQNAPYEGEKYFAKGNMFFQEYNPENYYIYTKYDAIRDVEVDDWYVGKHWAYNSNYNEGYFKYYLYVNKPITEDEYSLSLDDMLYWNSKVRGPHRSKDRENNTLVCQISKDDLNLRQSGWTDIPDMQYWDPGYMRFHGRTLESCCYESVYVGDGKYDKYVVFSEFEFGSEEAVVTNYFFMVQDFLNHGLTMDNYKSKAAEVETTQHYDLLHSIYD